MRKYHQIDVYISQCDQLAAGYVKLILTNSLKQYFVLPVRQYASIGHFLAFVFINNTKKMCAFTQNTCILTYEHNLEVEISPIVPQKCISAQPLIVQRSPHQSNSLQHSSS